MMLYASNHYIHVYMYASWEVRQLLAKCRQFPPGTPVSSANKTDRHDKMLKVALNTNQSINRCKKIRFASVEWLSVSEKTIRMGLQWECR